MVWDKWGMHYAQRELCRSSMVQPWCERMMGVEDEDEDADN